jgi:membrane-associated phospholipid phosphatase
MAGGLFDLIWENLSVRLIVGVTLSSCLLFGMPEFAHAQQVSSPMVATPSDIPQAGSPAYFMPPSPTLGSAVIESRPPSKTSPVLDSNLVDTLPPPNTVPYNAPTPWYETDWGVAAIGVAGVTMAFDHGINFWVLNHISYTDRTKVALRIANVGELAPLAFAGLTMIQSPISDPELAHASSIAVTAGAVVTAESLGLKYAIGRQRPENEDSSPFVFHPFTNPSQLYATGSVFGGGDNGTSSFPSGHTALAFALITPYAELYHAPALYTIPVVVGLARVAAQDGHWASDAVGGGFIGWLTADVTRRLFPQSDYGLMIFGDGQSMRVGIHGQF